MALQKAKQFVEEQAATTVQASIRTHLAKKRVGIAKDLLSRKDASASGRVSPPIEPPMGKPFDEIYSVPLAMHGY